MHDTDMTDAATPALLGVESSLTHRYWRGPDPQVDRLAQAIIQQANISPILAKVLARQSIAPDQAQIYLAPTLRDLLPDPHRLKDMQAARARIIAALHAHHKIAIFADYDVDGACSAALLVDWLRQMGADPTLYIPDRIDEGYGPNDTAMAMLARAHDLIICVDCGTLSHGPIAAAKGADVIVLDHHLAQADLPDCVAVVNPNRQDEPGDLGHLCAAGVVFLVLVDVNRQLKTQGIKTPDLMAMLDLVALATVADVAPLIGVNRALVQQGLKIMARRARPGLVALCDRAKLTRPPDSYHLGFVLGPRINAGGRIGQADLGARLLIAPTLPEAQIIAQRLETLNEDRRMIEAETRAAALAQVQTRGDDGPLVWAADQGWHPGVVGIVASRLKDTTQRPAIVIGFDGEQGKGSGRSVQGVDLGAAIQRLAAEGLIERGGGHKMAAGLSLTRAQLEPAMDRLADLIARQSEPMPATARSLRIDGMLMPSALQPDLVKTLESAGPYGASAPVPRFVIPNLRVKYARPVGNGHLKLTLGDESASIDTICFNAVENGLDHALQTGIGRAIHAVGQVEINHWNGQQKVQLRLDDAAWADQTA
jgi:single-stranded-DNA-specific exonuclease